MDTVMMNLLDMGALNLILSLAEPFFSAFIIYYFMRKLLPTRLNIYAICALSLIYTLWVNSRNPELFGTGYHLFMNLFINAFTYFIVIFLFKGKFWKNLIVWWYFDIIKRMCEAVSYVPVLIYRVNRGFGGEWAQVVSSVESDAMLKLLHMAACISLFLLLGFLSLTIWRGILMRKFHPFYLLFFALPMGQIYSLAQVIPASMGDWFFGILSIFVDDVATAYNILSIFGISISLAASAAILYYVLSHDKRAAVEAELREAKRVMEFEQARYGEMEKRSEELAKIRHDFNNQLASIVQLVRAGEDDTAQEIISALTNELNGVQNT
jgi:sensor histidine kinase YesM